ncbi:MAG: lytic transglycosylase domain-containing protein [Candidatus Rokubacteria bacterium]|nr:lytic transglycosylase domain-containing protein [Candidatus Rokubacteria bacterium]
MLIKPLVACLAIVAMPAMASAETFRLVAPDGTVHYTNAPTDPAYLRMGLTRRRPAPSPLPAALSRRTTFVDFVRAAAQRYGVPEKLVLAVIHAESRGNPWAVSPKGARGLMQLMPQTASLLGVRDSFDPEENIDGGIRHLRRLIDRYGNDLRLALAAYNAGEQVVAQYGGVPPYAETQGYVQKVLAQYRGDDTASPAPAGAPPLDVTYRVERDDGTVVYTNVRPPGSRTR